MCSPTEVLHLVATTRYFVCLLLWLVWRQLYLLCQVYMTCCITKATAVHFIDSKYHIKKLKSCRTGLANHKGSTSHHILPLVINSFWGEHTRIPMCRRKQFQETWQVPGLKNFFVCMCQIISRKYLVGNYSFFKLVATYTLPFKA